MLNFKTLSEIFSNFLECKSNVLNINSKDRLVYLIKMSIETNWKQWHLEDSARMTELSPKHIADIKQEIDKSNQARNDLITEIDVEIINQMKVAPLNSQEKFYSESPGMIIDRLAILHIKLSVIKDLLKMIKETELIEEYKKKKSVILRQINLLGNFLDDYMRKIKHKEVFFEAQRSVKIYNDKRIKKYINVLSKIKKIQ